MLEIENLSVSYRGIAALTDVSLHVDSSELVVIVGANGAGKSTLFQGYFWGRRAAHRHNPF